MNIHFDLIQGPALRVLAKALIEIAEIQEQQARQFGIVGALAGNGIAGGGDVTPAAEQRQEEAPAKKPRAKKEPEQAAPAPAPEPAPAKPAVTLEQVRAMCASKSQVGKAPEVKQLLQKFGAAKLTDVDPAKFADLLTEVEAL